jgi:molybdate transport system ATP-binding protein
VLLRCVVAAHDAARGLTRLEFPGGALLAPLRAEPVGAALRVRLRARDVAVALAPSRGISIRNLLPATLSAIEPTGPHEAFLRLMVGPTTLLARVTRDAVAELALAPGAAVVALVKSITFDGRGGGG